MEGAHVGQCAEELDIAAFDANVPDKKGKANRLQNKRNHSQPNGFSGQIVASRAKCSSAERIALTRQNTLTELVGTLPIFCFPQDR